MLMDQYGKRFKNTLSFRLYNTKLFYQSKKGFRVFMINSALIMLIFYFPLLSFSTMPFSEFLVLFLFFPLVYFFMFNPLRFYDHQVIPLYDVNKAEFVHVLVSHKTNYYEPFKFIDNISDNRVRERMRRLPKYMKEFI